MERPGATTLKGNPKTLIGPELKPGDPAQAPLTHVLAWHAAPGSQVPIGLQVSGVVLAPHWVLPGVQEPPQLPFEQRFMHTGPATHLPVSSHAKGVRASGPAPHFFMPGLQSPVQSPLPVQTLGHESAATSHNPSALHV